MNIHNFIVDKQHIMELERFGFSTDKDVLYQDVFKWLDETHGIHVSFTYSGFLGFPNGVSATFTKFKEVVHEGGGRSGQSGFSGHADFAGGDYTKEDLLDMENGIIRRGLNDVITYMKKDFELYEIK